MIVSRLALKNWRNFRQLDLRLTQRVFVIGPNASGKSNLLDVFRFLRDIAKVGGGLQQATAKRGGVSRIRCLAARKEPAIEIEVELSENGGSPVWKYAIGLTQQVRGHRQPVLSYEKVWRDNDLIRSRPDKDDKRDKARLTQTHLEQINSNAQFRDVARFLESIRYLHLVPQLLRNPEAFQGLTLPEDPYGRNFLELVVKTPEKTRRSRLKKIEGALRNVVPQLTRLTDTKDEAGVPHLEASYDHWRPNAGRVREDQFSDGTIRLIGLFWSLLEGEAPLLLEEPELSLHSKIVEKLPALFHGVHRKTKRQILVSTHSWDLLSDLGIGGEEVVVLTPDKEGTKAEVGSSMKDVRAQLEAGLSVADAALPQTTPAGIGQMNLFD